MGSQQSKTQKRPRQALSPRQPTQAPARPPLQSPEPARLVTSRRAPARVGSLHVSDDELLDLFASDQPRVTHESKMHPFADQKNPVQEDEENEEPKKFSTASVQPITIPDREAPQEHSTENLLRYPLLQTPSHVPTMWVPQDKDQRPIRAQDTPIRYRGRTGRRADGPPGSDIDLTANISTSLRERRSSSTDTLVPSRPQSDGSFMHVLENEGRRTSPVRATSRNQGCQSLFTHGSVTHTSSETTRTARRAARQRVRRSRSEDNDQRILRPLVSSRPPNSVATERGRRPCLEYDADDSITRSQSRPGCRMTLRKVPNENPLDDDIGTKHVGNVDRVHAEFANVTKDEANSGLPAHAPLGGPNMPIPVHNSDGATSPVVQHSNARQRQANENHYRWIHALDHREDFRYETIRPAYSHMGIRVMKKGPQGESLTPRRGSDPVHWSLLNGVIGSRHLKKSPSPPRLRPRGATSLPCLLRQPYCNYGFDGAFDDYLADEDSPFRNEKDDCHKYEVDSNWHFVDDPVFTSDDPSPYDGAAEDLHPPSSRVHIRSACDKELLVLSSTAEPRSNLGSDGMTALATYLDSTAATNMPPVNNIPRQAPAQFNQQQIPQQHQVNGIGGGAHATNIVNGGLQHAGHQMDINYLWSVVQELSEVLVQNRAQTARIIGSVQQIQSRAREEGVEPTVQQVNGELTGETGTSTAAAAAAAEIASLESRLQTMTHHRDALAAESADHARITADYESVLANVMDKIRHYAYEHTSTIVALHKHYNNLLEKERETNLGLRLEHAEWQRGLGRVMENARGALREGVEEGLEGVRRWREVRGENRVLRRLVGWEVSDDDDDEEGDGEGEEVMRSGGQSERLSFGEAGGTGSGVRN